MALEMSSSVQGVKALLTLSGELDGSSAPAVRETVDRLLSSSPSHLVLSVEKLSFMASAGLRILIFAKQKQPSLKIYFVKPQETVVETLKKTGFYQGVYITDSENIDEAAG
ncbi:MAG TPA: anti-sigma factor antagonist [Nitrospiraceae bacterium]|jgi:anti-anti-sigma factor|nr:anti-sigma factor antagonist [Nitrospiraceae bacterium]